MKLNPSSAIFAIRRTALSAVAILLLAHGAAQGKGSVVNSPHNLSASGGTDGKHGVVFAEEKRICVFCHVPHTPKSPEQLWSHKSPAEALPYTTYWSTTLKSQKPEKPTGASRLCLSCHDGTIALGEYVGSPISGASYMPSDTDPTLNPNLGTALDNDHPISFPYTEALAAQQGELASPATLPVEIRLEWGLVLQCTACHDPHNNEFGNFLVIDNNAAGSPLCVTCHKNTGWDASTHKPLGCMNCHYAHNARRPDRLLHYPQDEDNCISQCHKDSASPLQNVQPLFDPARNLHRHPVDQYQYNPDYRLRHDEKEDLPAQTPHVECVDCHNSHRANSAGIPLSAPPAVNGPLAGVRIDNLGSVADKEYEICFKCHSGSNASNFSGQTESKTLRIIQEPDQKKRFEGQNPSFHPVMAQRRGDGRSLIDPPFKLNMLMIYCSDCHNSDQSTKAGGSGPNGPHASQWEHILMARYDMSPPPADDNPQYSSSLYDLCFRCHDVNYVMVSGTEFANQGVNEHARHVQDRKIPCFACHDPHGISSTTGTVANNSHLINFNKDYAPFVSALNPKYETLNPRSGTCTVNCHTTGSPDPKTHSYSPL